MLSDPDQERFSRHLLLDAFGGAGQEKLRAGAVAIELPEPLRAVARSCARSLAAAGVGTLALRGEWTESIARECQRVSPDLRIVSEVHEATAPKIVFVSIEHEPRRAAHLTIPETPPRSLAEAAALGALCALEAMKLLAGVGKPAPLPLRAFPS